MKTFWLLLLERGMHMLLGADWHAVRTEVELLMSDEEPGAAKRQRVYLSLRKYGSQAASWLLYAAIEIAYGMLVKRFTTTKS